MLLSAPLTSAADEVTTTALEPLPRAWWKVKQLAAEFLLTTVEPDIG